MTRILLVDDDPELRNLLNGWLVSEDYQVQTAENGLTAWQSLQNQEYDLVILDWDLPDLKGIDLLRMYRAGGGNTPVLFLTGREEVDDKSLGLDAGADDYLTKPFHPKELSSRLRALLRRTQAQKAAPKPLGTNNMAVLKKGNLTGTTLAAHYEFLDVLGEGAVGVVFRARNPHLDKLVAIKMLNTAQLTDEIVARFEREARAVSRLDHPGITAIYDFGVTEHNQRYMVMEFVEGQSLDAVLEAQDFLPLPRALQISIQICDAMAHAHHKGVLHRDLKPSNIMLKGDAEQSHSVKILDFGLAKLNDKNTAEAAVLTQTGQVFGSPMYMSPEQVHGDPTDERSDIYSFGCLIYEAVTGYPPLLGKSAAEVMYKHIAEAPPSLVEMRPELSFPDNLQLLLSKTLEKDCSKRYQSMLELKGALENVATAPAP
jgi:serine/threonine protein kinase